MQGKLTSQLAEFLKKRIGTRDFYLGIFLLGLSLLFLFYLIPYHVPTDFAAEDAVKPDTFPYGISVGILVLGLILIFICPTTSMHESRREDKQVTKNVLGLIALLFLFYSGIYLFGLVPIGIIVIIVLARIFGYTKWLVIFTIAVVLVVTLFLFFEHLAQVSVPRGIFFEDFY